MIGLAKLITPSQVIEQSDYWRCLAGTDGLADQKEWSYFCVFGETATLIVNMSISESLTSTGASGAGKQGRVVVLLRGTGGLWQGLVTEYAAECVSVVSGRIKSRFGASRLDFEDGAYRLHLDVGESLLHGDLWLTPAVRPALTRSVPLGKAEPMRWLVVPRLLTHGEVRFGEQRHQFTKSPAYHDHNWGQFAWGGDFAWEWGICLSKAAAGNWSIIYYRITDRARHHAISQGLLLWRDELHCRTFQDRELHLKSEGFLRTKNLLRIPGATALAIPGSAADIPRRIEVRGELCGDLLEVLFELTDRAQIGVPNDNNGDFTTISETHGTARVSGRVRGERVDFESAAVLEFNRAS